jgi:hypothetical protein
MIYGKKNLAYIYALTLSASLVSCGPKDADKVGEAQLCIDKATQGTAAACSEKVTGIDTPAANMIRCSAGFIDEGFTKPARFKSAFDAFSTNSTNNTEAFMSILSFTALSSNAANAAAAEATYQACSKTGGKGLMMLGSMAITATTLAQIAGTFTSGSTPTETEIHNALASAVGNPAATAAIGSAITTTYTASCQSGDDSNKALCDQLDTALVGVDTTDSAAVGQAVLNYWGSN